MLDQVIVVDNAHADDILRALRDAGPGSDAAIVRGNGGTEPALDFARSTATGLSQRPRKLECRFLYDGPGSALFDRITEQPEYYLTRTEAGILAANAHRIREITGPVTIVELGSGYSVKTEYLLLAWLDRAPLVNYIPVDVSEHALREACRNIASVHFGARVMGVNCEYREAFPMIGKTSPAMVVFLGSTIGNFEPDEASSFLSDLAGCLRPDDFLLIGIDLVKEQSLIEAAYDDAAGVTAEFTRNLFARMNRELGSDINTSTIEHVARYSPEREQVEIDALFSREQTITVAQAGTSFTIPRGELIRTEVSRKYRVDAFVRYLQTFGLELEQVFTDERQWFALALMRRAGG